MTFQSMPISTIKLITINNQKMGVNNSFLMSYRIAINNKIITPNKKQKKSHLEKSLNKHQVPTIAVSDYVKMSSEQIAPYVSGAYYALGTDGFGRSDTRENLRHFFEIDRYYIVLTAVRSLAIEEKLEMRVANEVIKKYNIDSNKPSPITI